jgi:hypothetical protein
MSTRIDTLEKAPSSPDRVVYATGVLLDALDFEAEQNYHRGRLARALAYLHGSGTASGLRVDWEAPLEPGDDPNFPDGREERLLVRPGVALDRLGRVIEVAATACLRLDRWFDGKRGVNQLVILPNVTVGALNFPNAVIADVFVNFVACERGKTPAFAAGPFDALDAVQPSRLRDFYDLELIVRDAVDAPLPTSPWAEVGTLGDPAARRDRVHEIIFDSWREGTDAWDESGPTPLPEHVAGQNPTAVFLARLVIPLDAADPPQRDMAQDVVVQNDVRQFVYTTGALLNWLG